MKIGFKPMKKKIQVQLKKYINKQSSEPAKKQFFCGKRVLCNFDLMKSKEHS